MCVGTELETTQESKPKTNGVLENTSPNTPFVSPLHYLLAVTLYLP